MSTDFDIVCMTCKQRSHLGQIMAARCSFGYGSKDVEGREEVAEKVYSHLGHDLRIYVVEDGPNFTNEISRAEEFQYEYRF